MFKNFSAHFMIRFLALVLIPLQLTAEFLITGGISFSGVALSLNVSCILLLFHPSGSEPIPAAVAFFAAYALSVLVLRLVGASPSLVLFAGLLLYSSYVLLRGLRKYMCFEDLFKVSMIWDDFEEYVSCVYAFLVFTTGLLLVAGSGNSVVTVIASVLSAVLYVLLHYKAYTKRSLFIPPADEEDMHSLILESEQAFDDGGRDVRVMFAVFRRVESCMAEKKPFLNPALNLEGLAKEVGTNRTYLSYSVNKYAKMNVRTYINYHRLRHAVAMIDANPSVKLNDVAQECGFKGMSAFDTAFYKKFLINPSEYAQQRQLGCGSLLGQEP